MTHSFQPVATTTQRRLALSHLKVVVKRLSLAGFLLITFLILGSVTGISSVAEKIADRLVLYVHMAQLYTKDPDRKLAMPVKNVSKDQIANTWHAPRGTDRLHEGQDIFAPRGTPVLSATEGYILRIGENTLGGQTVSVVGAGGRVYYYAHLDSYAPRIEEGDYVTTKSVLGYVGTTGNAAGTPPHLHFGVYATGGPVNPLPLLSDRPQEKKPQVEAARSTRTRNRVVTN
jgi:murein DD-endopeptidase MepM/ murein hydrolase activator NlpD